MLTTKQIYTIVKNECDGLDAVYEDYIISLVGLYGLLVLKCNKLLESCGVINGRQLYAICEKEES